MSFPKYPTFPISNNVYSSNSMIEKMGGDAVGGRVEVINVKGCSRLFPDFSSSFRGISSFSLEPSSPASAVSQSPFKSTGPFSGLVICVTGLSKETRNQVKEATERLGGRYSAHLHPQCTHLVVQSFRGPKFEHALKHGPTNGLFLVTIGWFVDSVKRNVRLKESLYNVNNAGDMGIPTDVLKRLDQNIVADNSCLPVGLVKNTTQPNMIEAQRSRFSESDSKRQSVSSSLSGHSFYIDVDVPTALRSKVLETLYAEGASLVDQWFIGCKASHVVCEGPSIRKYMGHSSSIVTPLWVLKSAKEKCQQRLVNLSADLARYTGRAMIESSENGVPEEEANTSTSSKNIISSVIQDSHGERQAIVTLAKDGVRKRRNRRMQTCQNPIRPITPSSLLDSICWSISEPTSAATIYTDSSSGVEINVVESVFFDAKEGDKESEASFVNLSRPLTESEKSELILKSHFLTIMFPVDRFSEMGPCSRTFFSNKGFTCLQVLDHIYEFYQENMSNEEIEIAIHTDSRYADRLRSAYSSKECGYVEFKRIDFLGSRRSFEMLKRVSGDNSSNVYELLIRA